MSGGPPRGVWGQRINSSSGGDSVLFSTEWLVSKMDKVGLDGSICAEYISSLIELHKSSSIADRDAAISEFLHDSIPSSSLRTIAEQNRFVEETLSDIRQRINKDVAPLAVTQAVASKSKGSFKKGTKLSGTALKEIVGSVKPSYVQQYSDDEKAPPPPPSVPGRFVSATSIAEPAETPLRQMSLSSRRRSNKAKEIGPNENWDDEDTTTTPWKTPFESRSPIARILPVIEPVVIAQEKEPEVAPPSPPAVTIPDVAEVKSVLLSPQSLLCSLPTDILSFDFQFEEDDEPLAPPQGDTPFDLLKQMFTTDVIPTASVAENQPPPGFVDNRKVYTVPFLLSVLKEMKSESSNGEIGVPDELRGLSKTEVLVSPTKPRSDSFGWRSHEKPVVESNQGSWRASGYNHKSGSRRPPQVTIEEGFW
jgi:hypothetical protein